MEGKLIKEEKEYYALYTNKGIFISDVNGGSIANRLSFKNCQAIENGYDLDELAECNIPTANSMYNEIYKKSFMLGFQKALEILGDKKFSEDDIKRAILKARIRDKDNPPHPLYSVQSIVQSLQQTEWDCIIFVDKKTNQPLLDNEGNLILKRK